MAPPADIFARFGQPDPFARFSPNQRNEAQNSAQVSAPAAVADPFARFGAQAPPDDPFARFGEAPKPEPPDKSAWQQTKDWLTDYPLNALSVPAHAVGKVTKWASGADWDKAGTIWGQKDQPRSELVGEQARKLLEAAQPDQTKVHEGFAGRLLDYYQTSPELRMHTGLISGLVEGIVDLATDPLMFVGTGMTAAGKAAQGIRQLAASLGAAYDATRGAVVVGGKTIPAAEWAMQAAEAAKTAGRTAEAAKMAKTAAEYSRHAKDLTAVQGDVDAIGKAVAQALGGGKAAPAQDLSTLGKWAAGERAIAAEVPGLNRLTRAVTQPLARDVLAPLYERGLAPLWERIVAPAGAELQGAREAGSSLLLSGEKIAAREARAATAKSQSAVNELVRNFTGEAQAAQQGLLKYNAAAKQAGQPIVDGKDFWDRIYYAGERPGRGLEGLPKQLAPVVQRAGDAAADLSARMLELKQNVGVGMDLADAELRHLPRSAVGKQLGESTLARKYRAALEDIRKAKSTGEPGDLPENVLKAPEFRTDPAVHGEAARSAAQQIATADTLDRIAQHPLLSLDVPGSGAQRAAARAAERLGAKFKTVPGAFPGVAPTAPRPGYRLLSDVVTEQNGFLKPFVEKVLAEHPDTWISPGAQSGLLTTAKWSAPLPAATGPAGRAAEALGQAYDQIFGKFWKLATIAMGRSASRNALTNLNVALVNGVGKQDLLRGRAVLDALEQGGRGAAFHTPTGAVISAEDLAGAMYAVTEGQGMNSLFPRALGAQQRVLDHLADLPMQTALRRLRQLVTPNPEKNIYMKAMLDMNRRADNLGRAAVLMKRLRAGDPLADAVEHTLSQFGDYSAGGSWVERMVGSPQAMKWISRASPFFRWPAHNIPYQAKLLARQPGLFRAPETLTTGFRENRDVGGPEQPDWLRTGWTLGSKMVQGERGPTLVKGVLGTPGLLPSYDLANLTQGNLDAIMAGGPLVSLARIYGTGKDWLGRDLNTPDRGRLFGLPVSKKAEALVQSVVPWSREIDLVGSAIPLPGSNDGATLTGNKDQPSWAGFTNPALNRDVGRWLPGTLTPEQQQLARWADLAARLWLGVRAYGVDQGAQAGRIVGQLRQQKSELVEAAKREADTVKTDAAAARWNEHWAELLRDLVSPDSPEGKRLAAIMAEMSARAAKK